MAIPPRKKAAVELEMNQQVILRWGLHRKLLALRDELLPLDAPVITTVVPSRSAMASVCPILPTCAQGSALANDQGEATASGGLQPSALGAIDGVTKAV